MHFPLATLEPQQPHAYAGNKYPAVGLPNAGDDVEDGYVEFYPSAERVDARGSGSSSAHQPMKGPRKQSSVIRLQVRCVCWKYFCVTEQCSFILCIL